MMGIATLFKTGLMGPGHVRSLVGSLKKAANLGDLDDPSAARTSLGLGNMAVFNITMDSGQADKQVVVNETGDGLTLVAGGGGGGGAAPGTMGMYEGTTPPDGTLELDGSAIAVASYSALTAAVYCGDANNALADFYYRCTDDGDPTNTRDIAGSFLVLKDMRGESPRGWDNGRGVDSGRSLWEYQAGQNKSHTHTGTTNTTGAHTHTLTSYYAGGTTNAPLREGSNPGGSATTSSAGNHSHTVTIDAEGGTENIVRNAATMFIIKY